ncbi:ABC transporter permease [Streptomyces bambusae]|uniref:ABC transporter permease n=1 Tax=Streptomyces bambusae TaxID=1550616 RepID=UPI001CFD3019|nr:ABC transporter permease [Streptomyces bambusae]MCB5167238.1 ABC transporter permease [Streptomyces bambusae]
MLVVGMWVRSTLAYRASFALALVGSALTSALDFVGIYIMFTHIDALGGFSLPEVALLYGTAGAALGLADLLLGNTDRVGARIRDGSLDTMLVRPVPVFAQVAADRFALRRLGRVLQGAAVTAWGAAHVDVAWTADKVLLLPLTVLAGTAIFAAVFLAGAAFQFVAGDAAEVQNSFTYGGATMLQYPPSVFGREMVRGVVFVVPLAFVNWLPALYLLGRPQPFGLPWWTAFLSPFVALLVLAPAAVAWRAGLRSYRSTGS